MYYNAKAMRKKKRDGEMLVLQERKVLQNNLKYYY